MELIFALLGLAVPAGFVWLFFSHIAMRKTVRRLREDVERLKTAGAGSPETSDDMFRVDEASPWAPTASPQPEARDEPFAAAIEAEAPPRRYVLMPETAARLKAWLRQNWLIVVGASSLAMAGVFLVDYGVEQGVLSPPLRVLCGLFFGAGLIVFGDWIRRKGGDLEGAPTALLPSAFAGAGIVTLFSSIIAARRLYALAGAEAAFVALAGIAVLAVFLGWVYGPFLTVIGAVGAVAAPFVVGGEAESVDWLFYYFALIAAVGLGVDALKRSAWVSGVALAAPTAGAVLAWLGSGSPHALAYAVLLAAAAISVPTLSLRPVLGGAMTFRAMHGAGAPGWPDFPTRLASGGLLTLAGFAVVVSMSGEAGFWLALLALAAALAALGFWWDRGGALDDLAAPLALAMLAIVGLQGLFDLVVARAAVAPEGAEAASLGTIARLVAFGAGVTVLAGLRSIRAAPFALAWAAGSAIFAPAVLLLLAMVWDAPPRGGDLAWAAQIVGVAAVMTALAERTRRGEDHGGPRTALFALAALNLLALAMAVVLTETSLTLGFAAIVFSAAWLDRRFDFRLVSWFVQLGAAACGYRLLVDPGLPWALETSLSEVSIGFVGVIGLLAAAWASLRRRARIGALIATESAAFGLGGVYLSVLLYRALAGGDPGAHWSLALFATVWMLSAAIQLHRAQIDGPMRRVRLGLGAAFGGLGFCVLAAAATVANPLLGDPVIGPPVVDSLAVAYLIPAALLGAAAWRFAHLDKRARLGLGGASATFALLYFGLEIRRFWRGDDVSLPGVGDGELYSYTIAMLLCGSGLLLTAYLRRSSSLRQAAVAVIGLTIAKVFLVDMAGLQGLIRVLSFLALGLFLAGLALLNRWITQRLDAEAAG